MAKLEEGGAYGVIIIDNRKPNERSSHVVHYGRITANAIVWYIDYQSNSLSC